jgi:hypothetical protein
VTGQVWVRLMADPGDRQVAWGPFADTPVAQRFAMFVTEEIDPAEVIKGTGSLPPRDHVVVDPVHELLAWRDMWESLEAMHGPPTQDVDTTAATSDGEPVL